MQKVNKKVVYLVICIFLSLVIYPTVMGNMFSTDDELDQHQNDTTNDNALIDATKRWAQSFRPGMVVLSRVELFMENKGSSDQITVSIRKDLDGPDLTGVTVSSSIIPNYEKTWIEFDFSDITVEPEESYFIVCDHTSQKSLLWAASFNNQYIRGKAYYQELEPLSSWESWEETMPFPYSVDLCFRTYGLHHAPTQPTEPKGPAQVRVNGIAQYVTSSTDLDGDLIRYGWDFNDDDIVDEWTDYFESGEICTINVSWSQRGDHLIKVIAEDNNGILSKWSDSKILVVPKYMPISFSDWFVFIQHMLNLFF